MVLSAARNRLHSLTNTETYYVDTDCIMCTRAQYLPLSTELGGLKYDHGVFKLAGTKAYGKRDGDHYLVKLRGYLPPIAPTPTYTQPALLTNG
jgi:hypothetical protein